MAYFSLEAELKEVLRMDSSVHLAPMSKRHTVRAPSTSSLIGLDSSCTNNISINLNKSRSMSQLVFSPTKSRSNTPTRILQESHLSKTPSHRNSKSPARIPTTNASNIEQDRFIPNRSTTDLDYAHHSLMLSNDNEDSLSLPEIERRRKIEENLNPNVNGDSRILSFKNKAPQANDGHLNNMKYMYSTGKSTTKKAANTRQVSNTPEKILDAPDMINDFYLHLLDWSCLNHLAVALAGGVYIWNAGDGSIVNLLQKESEEEYVSSVSWMKQGGGILAVGDSNGSVQLWDVAKQKLMRVMDGHTSRVASLDWNVHMIVSGSKTGAIHQHDVRVPRHHVATYDGHTQEICGLAWSPDGRRLASGGNDNLVQVWQDGVTNKPEHTLSEHQSAVKAISWCPWQSHVLATGGGTVDRMIKFWNVSNAVCMSSTDTRSQVSAIVWNSDYRELVSGHGFANNQLTVWKYPGMNKMADLTGHKSRVLHLVASADNTSVASVAADETIRIWKLWPTKKEKKVSTNVSKHPVGMLTKSLR